MLLGLSACDLPGDGAGDIALHHLGGQLAEIEGELINHPAVQDVAVFGIPNADWGEEIKAVVELHEGFEPSDELAAEITAWAGTRMGKFKLPRSIDFVDQLPREPNGKLIKRKLRDPYWEGVDRQI